MLKPRLGHAGPGNGRVSYKNGIFAIRIARVDLHGTDFYSDGLFGLTRNGGRGSRLTLEEVAARDRGIRLHAQPHALAASTLGSCSNFRSTWFYSSVAEQCEFRQREAHGLVPAGVVLRQGP